MDHTPVPTFTLLYCQGPVALLGVTGEIDVNTAPALRARALEVIGQGHPRLILDLAAVPFCDSSGLNALIGILRCGQGIDGSLTLAAVPDRLARLLNVTGVGQIMPSYPIAADALTAHEPGPVTGVAERKPAPCGWHRAGVAERKPAPCGWHRPSVNPG